MKGIKKHYHWLIAFIMFLMTFIYSGLANTLNTIHIIPVTNALNITRLQFSIGGTVSAIITTFVTMLSGFVLHKLGHRITVSFFMTIAALGYFVFACAESYPVFLLGNVFLGIAAGFCSTSGATRIISGWFHKHKGTVLGIVLSASGIGGSVISIIQSRIIESSNYQNSYHFAGIAILILAILIGIFVRNRPEDMKLKPYGDGEIEKNKKLFRSEAQWHGFSMKQLMRRPAFYMMLVFTLLSSTAAYLGMTSMNPYFQDCGMSQTQASELLSIQFIALTIAKLLAGYLCDKIGSKKVTMICLSFNVISLMCLIFVKGYYASILTSILIGFALPIVTITVPLLAQELFGYQAQTAYTGVVLAMISPANMIASLLSNAIFDNTGSYIPSYYAGIALTLVMLVAYPIMYHLAQRDRKTLEASEIEV